MNELIQIENGRLSFDFAKATEELAEQIAPYKNLVFTEADIKSGKECVATLRKERKSFEDAMKDAKKAYMQPFEDFWEKGKEYLAMYDEPIAHINEQLDEYELRRVEAKQTEIKAYYAEIVTEEELADILPLAKIQSSKWLNKTATAKSIKEELMNIKLDAKMALETIKSFGSDKEQEAIEIYKRGLNMTEAVAYIQRYEKEKAEILKAQEEKARQEELERAKAEERAKIEAEQQLAQAVSDAKEQGRQEFIEEFTAQPSTETDLTVKSHSMIISATDAEWDTLIKWLDSCGYEYEELIF